MYNALQTRLREAREDEGGFTLIELLIVIVILGVLAAVVVFSVRGINNRGEVASCKATQKTLDVAVEAQRANTGAYPATFGALVTAGYLRADTNFTTGSGAVVDVVYSGSYEREFTLGANGLITIDTAC